MAAALCHFKTLNLVMFERMSLKLDTWLSFGFAKLHLSSFALNYLLFAGAHLKMKQMKSVISYVVELCEVQLWYGRLAGNFLF